MIDDAIRFFLSMMRSLICLKVRSATSSSTAIQPDHRSRDDHRQHDHCGHGASLDNVPIRRWNFHLALSHLSHQYKSAKRLRCCGWLATACAEYGARHDEATSRRRRAGAADQRQKISISKDTAHHRTNVLSVLKIAISPARFQARTIAEPHHPSWWQAAESVEYDAGP